MELVLEIYKWKSRNGLCNYYNKGICELNYNGFRYKENNEEDWYTEKFPIWDAIQIEYVDDVKIDDEEFFEVKILQETYTPRFCVAKNDIDKLKDFCASRNQKVLMEKESVENYIDDDMLNIAENLLNIIEEDILLNYRVVARFHIDYSHIESKVFNRNYSARDEYRYHYRLSEYTEVLKGKAKKEAEKRNEDLHRKNSALSKAIDNFVEIIMEEKNVKEYIAKAVTWEAVQKKAIEYYSQKWSEEYEIKLEEPFSDFEKNTINSDTSQIVKATKCNYIKRVLLCDEIDIEHSQEILMYFLLSKCNMNEVILCDSFVEYYELMKEIKQNIDSSDMKQKLRTKQKRRITKYTIDDIDLMSGSEFEEFVGTLFKKMGYSSQVTKQSGDQGLDVIASKYGTKIGIQAKCYSNTVGNSAIQEAVAGKSFYRCDKVIVITNNYFTPAAIELAQSNDVILWNRDMLKEKIKELF